MYVKERFVLNGEAKAMLKTKVPDFGFNGFGEMLFYRTYSRTKADGGQENWADCVIRVIEGIFSIRKDHYTRNRIPWDDHKWQNYATKMAFSMFDMEWCPPGRGLWAMGTNFMYERGAMALYNCAYTDIGDDIPEAISWFMDSLMCGVGVGFGPIRNDNLKLYDVDDRLTFDYVIADTRESWCESVEYLLTCFLNTNARFPKFDYSLIRPAGLPIKGFGGISSGPAPLQKLHLDIVKTCKRYIRGEIDSVMLKADLANLVGCCVIAGNVRRSAEIACAPISDPVFIDLKNYGKYPYREEHGWMSNNSVKLQSDEDFERLGEIAQRVIKNGEPGYINMQNVPKGRVGKTENHRPDKAVGFNPCGEIPLESREVCNLAETCPTRCGFVARIAFK